MEKIDRLKNLIDRHAVYYGYYSSIDNEIEVLLKDLLYNSYDSVLERIYDVIPEFEYVYRVHAPIPSSPNIEGRNKYFENMGYWISFSVSMSWFRYTKQPYHNQGMV